MTEPAAGNPTSTAGVVTVIAGALSAVVAVIYGLMAVGEMDRYRSLVRAGNPFAGIVANSWAYLAGTAAVATLAAVGLLTVGVALMRGRFRA